MEQNLQFEHQLDPEGYYFSNPDPYAKPEPLSPDRAERRFFWGEDGHIHVKSTRPSESSLLIFCLFNTFIVCKHTVELASPKLNVIPRTTLATFFSSLALGGNGDIPSRTALIKE